MTDERLGQLATMVQMSAPGSACSVDVTAELYTEVVRLRRVEAGVDRWLVETRTLIELRIAECESYLRVHDHNEPFCSGCSGARAIKEQLQRLQAQIPLCAACVGPA